MPTRSGTSISSAARRAKGQRRLEVWIPEAYLAKLDAICEWSGYSRADQILGMIDAEMAEIERIGGPTKSTRSG